MRRRPRRNTAGEIDPLVGLVGWALVVLVGGSIAYLLLRWMLGLFGVALP